MKTDKLHKALDARALRRTYTFGLYCLETVAPDGKTMWFAPPFMSKDDDMALDAMIEVSKSHPEICGRNLYRVGTFCAVDGKVTSCRPCQVVRKEIGHVEEVSDAV